jgi:hypothetical protein
VDVKLHGLPEEYMPEKTQAEIPYSQIEYTAVFPLEQLKNFYIFEDHSAVTAFIEQNRLRGLLEQAREPLNAAFGEAALKKLTLVTDDEGSKTLFCLVRVPGDMQEARRALRSFDQRWWLGRSTQAAAKLNFDFELV